MYTPTPYQPSLIDRIVDAYVDLGLVEIEYEHHLGIWNLRVKKIINSRVYIVRFAAYTLEEFLNNAAFYRNNIENYFHRFTSTEKDPA